MSFSPSPMKLRPAHIAFIRLSWAGHTHREIADITGYTPQRVMDVLKSPEAQSILEQLRANALETADDVQQELVATGPEAAAVLQKQLYSGDEKIAQSAAVHVLHMTGHSPVKRVTVSKTSEVQKKYEDMDEEAIRDQMLGALTGNGPDGRPLN